LPIRDALILHVYRLRERAVAYHRHQQLLYGLECLGQHPPTLPPILMSIEEE
jgi:hypothetical protein